MVSPCDGAPLLASRPQTRPIQYPGIQSFSPRGLQMCAAPPTRNTGLSKTWETSACAFDTLRPNADRKPQMGDSNAPQLPFAHRPVPASRPASLYPEDPLIRVIGRLGARSSLPYPF